MGRSKQGLERTYKSYSDDELLNMYSRSEILSDLAQEVLKDEINKRGLTVPEKIESKTPEPPNKSLPQKILLWSFAFVGFVIMSAIVDTKIRPNRAERVKIAVVNTVESSNKDSNNYKSSDKPIFPPDTRPPPDFEVVVTNVLTQIQSILLNNESTSHIEDKINQARSLGATGISLDQYSNQEMGWSMKDSKNRTVYSIIFTFNNNKANKGKYLGPLMLISDALTMHGWYRPILSDNYSEIKPNKYKLSEQCVANLSLFEGSTGLGRSIINVECN